MQLSRLLNNAPFKFGVFLCLICCGLACGKPKNDLSIPEDKLIQILADAHLIESSLQTNYKVLKDSMTVVYYQQLYEIHGITEEEFRLNLSVLESDAKLMADIYAKVMDQLSKMEADHK